MPNITTHATDYGTVTIGPGMCEITADGWQLRQWSRRPGAHWPCSTLADLDSISVGFDSGGLVDLEQLPTWEEDHETGECSGAEIDGSELSAWSSDVLGSVLPGDHPAWLVTVGQFIDREDWPESAVKVWGN